MLSIRTAIFAAIFATLVPFGAVMGLLVWSQAHESEQEVLDALTIKASSVARAIDTEIDKAREILAALSATHYVDQRDFASLHEMARTILAGRTIASNILLFGADGTQLLNTRRPYGEALPNPFLEGASSAPAEGFEHLPRSSAPWIRQAVSEGNAVLSDLFYGIVAQEPIVALHVPVTRGDRVAYVWVQNFDAEALHAIVKRVLDEPGTHVAVVDRRGNLAMADVPGGERAGRPAREALRAAAMGAAPLESLRGRTRDGSFLQAAAGTASGWTVAVVRPYRGVGELTPAFWSTTAAAAASLVGVMMVLLLARRISGPLQQLARSAGAVQEGRAPAPLNTRLQELATLRDALSDAARARQVAMRLALLEGLVRYAPLGIALFDRDLRFVLLNERAAENDGTAIADHLGKTVAEVIGVSPFSETIERALREARDRGAPVTLLEVSGATPAAPGRQRTWFAAYIPLRDGEGAVTHLAAVSLEITERIAQEEALRASEENFRAMFEVASVGKVQIDAVSRRFIRVNAAFCAITGYTEAQLLGMTPADLTHPDDRARDAEDLGRMLRGEVPSYTSEKRYLRADGRVVWVHVAANLIRDAAGRPTRTAAVIQDITARKEAEAALQEADRRKDEFLAMLAHELRNPLAPIRNAAELLKHVGTRGVAIDRVRAMIEKQVNHLVRLVDDLLDVGRISQGKITLRHEPVDVVAVAREVAETCRPQIDARRHTLTLALPDAPLWVDGDSTRLAQVASNLLINAVKYTPEGGTIELTVARADGEALLRVTDNGRGMDEQTRSHLFELFYQAESPLDRTEGGLGIGLALVKALVTLHGGRIEAASDGPGRGSRFEVRLPLLQSAVAKTPAPAPQQPSAQHVLVVDDHRDAAETLAMLLRIDGHVVTTAYDGREAVRIALQERPGVVLLDLALPQMSGDEVCATLRQGGLADALIVAMTGYGHDVDRHLRGDATFDARLVKPVELAELRELLRRHQERVRERPLAGTVP